ncbi:MAG: hypothetical protein A2Z04_07980 [Chloroflexi bacterium RBG_16_57_9]|nr:MAG: hypothetical protein A2Z04_07980 [Chloroflexi bacterium RBG_16_57_9]
MSKKLLALSTSIAVLAGIWTWLAFSVPMLGPIPFVLWPTFVAWAAFFYAGATIEGMLKGIVQLFTGAIISWIMISIWVAMGAPGPVPLVLGIFVIIIAWPLTALSGVSKWWALVPAGFCGAASYFGVADNAALVAAKQAWTFTHLLATLFPLLAGELLGWLSNYIIVVAMPEKA